MKRMLLLVDPQTDFISGSLPVPGAAESMDSLARWLPGQDYAIKTVTLDFHPWNHSSFSDNGGQWPRHCVEYSTGSAIWPPLLNALNESPGKIIFTRKGMEADREEYSIFQNMLAARQIAAAIAEANIERIDICGLAGDICVLNTLQDGINIYGAGMFNVLRDFSPSLDGGSALKEFIQRR